MIHFTLISYELDTLHHITIVYNGTIVIHIGQENKTRRSICEWQLVNTLHSQFNWWGQGLEGKIPHGDITHDTHFNGSLKNEPRALAFSVWTSSPCTCGACSLPQGIGRSLELSPPAAAASPLLQLLFITFFISFSSFVPDLKGREREKSTSLLK